MMRRLITLLFGATLLIAIPVFAQVNFGGTSALTIVSSPSHPSPGSTVTLTAQSPLLDLENSDVEWTVNGTSAGSGQSISIQLGALGTQTVVSVSVSGASGSDSTQLSIVPTSVDLLWEAVSYTPPFYQGRALPTSGTMIRVLAIPHFVGSSGAIPASGIDFTWHLNNAVQSGQSGVGESSAVFPAATLYDSDTITVDAETPDGSISGEATLSIRTGDPELVLYEDSPLFGIMYHQALGQSDVAGESETSFAAVPYFADATSANDPGLAYSWSVNGSQVATDAQDPSEITVDAKSAGVAQIQLNISKPSDPFFGVNGSWAVSFSAVSASSQNNIFQTPQSP
jgi:hypothetical protein